MINNIITWLISSKEQREVIRAARKGNAYIVTEYYMYDISKIYSIILMGGEYVLELSNKIPLELHSPSPRQYEEEHRPETNIYLSSDELNTLISQFSEWNRFDKRVMLYYDKFVKSYKK